MRNAMHQQVVEAELVERRPDRSGLLIALVVGGSVLAFVAVLVLAGALSIGGFILALQSADESDEDGASEAGILKVTDETFDAEVLNSGSPDPVLVDFYAGWCGPCRTQARVLKKFAATAENVKIVKVDVDENLEIARRYNIESIPTLLVVKNGQVTARSEGLASESKLARLVRQ